MDLRMTSNCILRKRRSVIHRHRTSASASHSTCGYTRESGQQWIWGACAIAPTITRGCHTRQWCHCVNLIIRRECGVILFSKPHLDGVPALGHLEDGEAQVVPHQRQERGTRGHALPTGLQRCDEETATVSIILARAGGRTDRGWARKGKSDKRPMPSNVIGLYPCECL